MASPGNPHQGGGGVIGEGGGGFDMNKLLKPSSANPMSIMQPPNQQQQQQGPSPISNTITTENLTTSPSFPLPSSSPPYLTPSSSYPPPTGPYHPYHHPHYLSPYPPPPFQQLHNHFFTNTNIHHQNRPQPISSFAPPPPLSPRNSGGAVLMDILTNQNQQQPPLSTNLSGPFPSYASSTVSTASSAPPVPSAPSVSLASPTQQCCTPPVRMLSTKLPKGRHLNGSHVVYDIDVRLQGEVQPQLEVTPITKYLSDPGLVLGRQIAVNRNYICYGLKPGAIRILNINTALRSLLRGHNQKVTDMAFFAEDVHLLASACVDGCVFIRKINEGPDEEEKPQIFERILLALHIIADGELVHPRVCWHPHKQEILVVAIGNLILKIDTNKVGKGTGFSAERPLTCPVDKLIEGVQLVGKHDGEVIELSMCQWMTTRLASASTDGAVKIWEDRKAVPLAVFRPHDGNPVNSVAFLTAPDHPDHIVLITGGPLNQELKIWASASEEGWLLPSNAESWWCNQTLTLESSVESNAEDAFFDQVVALPRAGLFLLANAKKNAIYAVHLEYGPYPAATRMDYIAEFTVTMPILSLTGTSDSLPNGEHIVQVYCVQTQAIQQYALNLSQCLPPPLENMELEITESNVSHSLDSDGSAIMESSHGSKPAYMSAGNIASIPPMTSNSPESALAANHPESLGSSDVNSSLDIASSGGQTRATASHTNADNTNTVTPLLPMSPRLPRKLSGLQSLSNSTDTSLQLSDHAGDRRIETVKENASDTSSGDNLSKGEKNVKQTDIAMVSETPIMFKHPTHLITPSEILSRAVCSENSQTTRGLNVAEAKTQDVLVNNDIESAEVALKVVGETGTDKNNDFDLPRESHTVVAEKKEKSFYSQASDLGIQMARDCCVEAYSVGPIQQADEGSITEVLDRPPSDEDEKQDMTKDVPAKSGETETSVEVLESPAPTTKAKKPNGKSSQVSVQSSPSLSPFNSTDSSNEPGCSPCAQSSDAALPQILAMQDTLDQLMNMHKEMQKQMNTMISVPVSKEGKRLEASLGRSIEKVVRANTDSLWVRFQEENTKHEKLERDRIQQLANLITNLINKDLPTALEKTLKKEIAAIGPAVARAITPILEKSISSSIMESFQKGVGEKAVNQLEKTVTSKLEVTVARQIQSQFQTSGKQALQDALRSTLEASIIPAFEMSCKAMFDQVDATFQKELSKHINDTQQQFDSMHSPLAITLRDAINSASSLTQTLSGVLADGQQQLLALAAAGANSEVGNPSAKLGNGPLPGLHEMPEAPLDPTKELSRLIAERKYEEAFTVALHRNDVTIVSWLCSQVDLQGILSVSPLPPLSQGVLLALLQQLACDITNETSRKLGWMTDVAAAINPVDPMIAVHVRPIFEQVYQIVINRRSLPSTSASEAPSIRLLLVVINSVLRSCK
ncbi:PREDICTED: enhancer of mRNA-decapping protein 4-like [Populus euphratica]|uniref:Enhancer of mRNA-decapping protein 4-like n=1 Tax=Populus euphratica TaxID=75702 RepID=A0AAJ6T7S0_POPEU|nr:PREDICTED: enhancer of mRNA-decapping protein 4-like [Populus euphratica]XP_011005772.1 PREDICTED: enhancer of mRNA-decapping protein 4-like [Populus euphratica]